MEVGIALAVTLCYKTFVGGAHARTNFICLVSSTAFFFVPVIISKYVLIEGIALNIAYCLVFIFSIYIILRHAPADTEEIPILNKSRRRLFKVLGTISLILIYIISIIFIKNVAISKLIISTVLLIDIFTTKPIYKIFKCKYSYESDEFKEYYNK